MTLEIKGNTINGELGEDLSGVYSFYEANTTISGSDPAVTGSTNQWDYYVRDDQATGQLLFNDYAYMRLLGDGSNNSDSTFTVRATSNKDLKGKDFFMSATYAGETSQNETYSPTFAVYLMKDTTQQITLLSDTSLTTSVLKTGGGVWFRGWWTGTILNYMYGYQTADNPVGSVTTSSLDFGTDSCGVRFIVNKTDGAASTNDAFIYVPPIITMPYNDSTKVTGW